MQKNRIILFQWQEKDHVNEFYDIDWPAVHRECGVDHIAWINRQPVDNCEMTLEFFSGGTRLVVEFYDNLTANTYHLMWAK
jgi:hypothetical protein